jgi:hypothetical protein
MYSSFWQNEAKNVNDFSVQTIGRLPGAPLATRPSRGAAIHRSVGCRTCLVEAEPVQGTSFLPAGSCLQQVS